MSSQTLHGRVIASWAALLMSWLGFGLTKPQARDETSSSCIIDTSEMLELRNANSSYAYPATQREGSGFCYTPMTHEPSSTDFEETVWATRLRTQYGIARPMETE
jgi:hypothetical protein